MQVNELRSIIDLIFEKGTITVKQLALQVKQPKRRIYEILPVLEAADLITRTKGKIHAIVRSQNDSNYDYDTISITAKGFITEVRNQGNEVIIKSTSPGFNIDRA